MRFSEVASKVLPLALVGWCVGGVSTAGADISISMTEPLVQEGETMAHQSSILKIKGEVYAPGEVQVTINAVTASVATNDSGVQSVYRYEMPPGKPRLRVVKVASQKQAKPGEEIEFTLRFDNVGDQPVGNVTIVDSLTTRLEYVSDSAQCSVPASFLTQENDGESLVLRWEIADPLEVGKGGIIRFKCRVR